jgi:hypothetical protein
MTIFVPFIASYRVMPETPNQWSHRTRIKHSTHTCVVIVLNQGQWSEFHLPLGMCINRIGGRGLRNTHCICQRDQWHIYCVLLVRIIEHSAWDIPRTRALIVRDELLAQHQLLASTHTQDKVFQYSVSRTFWSQHNSQSRYSITWGTNNQIQYSHERPTLSLSRIHRILLFFWWDSVTHPDQFNR